MSGGSQKFAVVVFEEPGGDREVSLVPTVWLDEQSKKCRWPSFRDCHRISRAIKERWKPEESWKQYPMRVLGKCSKWLTS